MKNRVVLANRWWSLSGVNTFIQYLTSELIDLGFDAEILITNPKAKVPNPMVYPEGLPMRGLDIVAPQQRAAWPVNWRRLSRYLNSLSPCIYLPNDDYDFLSSLHQLDPGVRVVGVVHTDDERHYWHLDLAAPHCDAIVSVSSAIESRVLANHGDRPIIMPRIPYGVPTPVNNPRSNQDLRSASLPLRIVYAGRLEQNQKRIFDIPPLLSALDRLDISYTMDIYGDGPDRLELANLLADRVRDSRLTMHGTVPPDVIDKRLACADAMLLMSQHEGLPLVLLSAMAHGCVPIVSDIRSGINDIIVHKKNGMICSIGDIDAFATSIGEIAQDRLLLRSMSEYAYETIWEKRLSSRQMAESYASLFEKLMAQSPRKIGSLFPTIQPRSLNGVVTMRSKYAARRLYYQGKSLVDLSFRRPETRLIRDGGG